MPSPTYSLADVKDAIRRGEYYITAVAKDGASELYLDEDDIVECVLCLEEAHFHKTMPSRTVPGLMQDVYKCHCWSFPIYTKLQLAKSGQGVVISFKRDEAV